MTDSPYLEIHAALSEEIRHSDGLVWQLAIAIAAAEEGVVALSDHTAFQSTMGKGALAAGFFLSVCLSFVLLGHAYHRRIVVRRVQAVEERLSEADPKVFEPRATAPQWRASMLLAWFLLTESTVGFALLARHLFWA